MTNGQLTETETLRMENFVLKHNLLQAQMQQLLGARTACIAAIEENHPGYKWSEQSGSLQPEDINSDAR